VFGAYISDCWRLQEGWWGTGESFVFKLYPEFKTYKWRPDFTSLFVLSRPASLSIGGGNGVAIQLQKYDKERECVRERDCILMNHVLGEQGFCSRQYV
jgi:hypothetical protein